MKAHTLILPLPPSTNGLFVNAGKRGRVTSKPYRAWKTEAGFMLKVEPKWRVGGPVRLSIDLPTSARADLDNLCKAPIDLLVAHGRIDDDRNVAELHVTKTWARSESCRVTVEAMP